MNTPRHQYKNKTATVTAGPYKGQAGKIIMEPLADGSQVVIQLPSGHGLVISPANLAISTMLAEAVLQPNKPTTHTCYSCNQERPDNTNKCPHCEADAVPF